MPINVTFTPSTVMVRRTHDYSPLCDTDAMTAEVTVLLIGNIGNQLFQAAAALRYAPSCPKGVRFIRYVGQWADQPTIADLLGWEVSVPSRIDRARIPELARDPSPLNPLLARMAERGERKGHRTFVRQRNPFDAFPGGLADTSIVLAGYFQDRSWWTPTWRTVAEAVRRRAPAGWDELRGETPAVLQYRQGDYTQLRWGLGGDYYRRALRTAGLRHRDVIVTGDEDRVPTWLDDVLVEFGCRRASARALTGKKPMDDFWTMAAASTLILPNSTFSWWSAAVATLSDPPSVVVYPRPWIPNSWDASDPPDFGVDGWVAVESGLPPVR